MQRLRRLNHFICAACVIVAVTAPVAAQTFPGRTVRIVVPYVPGGGVSVLAQLLATKMQDIWGQPVIVDNRPGAGGTLGGTAMVNARPDGYVLMQLPLGIYRLPHMQKMLFDPIKDITHIVCLTGYTFGLAATADAPFKTLKEMVAYARANPGKLSYGSTGSGVTNTLAMEMFKSDLASRSDPEARRVLSLLNNPLLKH